MSTANVVEQECATALHDKSRSRPYRALDGKIQRVSTHSAHVIAHNGTVSAQSSYNELLEIAVRFGHQLFYRQMSDRGEVSRESRVG